ncbi:RidA family protein [soil metagenome]
MPKQILDLPSSPPALGPYSVAVGVGDLVFLSGQVAMDPATGERAPDEIEAQTRRVLDNIGSILTDLHLGYPDVVKTTIFLADIADYAIVNEIYSGYFDTDPPARSAVQAGALPGGFLIEIEAIACR